MVLIWWCFKPSVALVCGCVMVLLPVFLTHGAREGVAGGPGGGFWGAGKGENWVD